MQRMTRRARSRHHAFRGTFKSAMTRHRRETSSLNYDLSFNRAWRPTKAPTRFRESFSSKSTGKPDAGPTSTELMRTRNSHFSVSLRSFSVELFAVELLSVFWVIFCMTVPNRFRPTTRVSKRCSSRFDLRGGWLKSSALGPYLTIRRVHSSEHIGRCQH
jgi:hypothetical protein